MVSSSLTFYTDGACATSRMAGGWALYCPELNLQICGNKQNTTNNIMEITAVLSALKYIYYSNIQAESITIFSDSMYVIGTITQHWKINTNEQYWNLIFRYLSLINCPITFTHIYGHSGIEGNEKVDNLAVIMSNLI